MTQAQKTCSRLLKSSIALLCAFVVFGFLIPTAKAQESSRYYSYESINYSYTVNKDSTIDVEEQQTYNFKGTYHAAERVIPLNKIDDITHVSVRDGITGPELQKASGELNKYDQNSWGKYTVTKENNNYYIRWYYDMTDTTHTWVVSYKLHGALSFLKEKDELYWNLFNHYDVPIDTIHVLVTIPEHSMGTKNMQAQLYTGGQITGSSAVVDSRRFEFTAQTITPGEPVTFAAGWPRGIVSRWSYWNYFALQYLPYILAGLIVIACLIIGILYWYFTEKYNVGRGTIVPEYEPPQNLRPAMAEAIVKEGITNKAWAATIVDLAVRGYVKITEDTRSKWTSAVIVPLIIFAAIAGVFIIPAIIEGDSKGVVIFGIFILFIFGLNAVRGKLGFVAKDYIIERLGYPIDSADVEDYEKKFLDILGSRFSTRDMKQSGKSAKQEMFHAMQELKKDLYKETELDTRAYTVPLSHAKYIGYGFFGVFILIWASGFFGGMIGPILQQFNISAAYIITILVSVVAIGFLVLFMKFNPRLSEEGAILREKWLGFKMYLETAEKYRMQNLTPEIFEKYLPYAIIFGVEKKWAKSFENIAVAPPSWYVGPTPFVGSSGISGSSNISSFSASAFSASFSSSLASSFSSAGGGASGGGGSAGGGGGGGGGGAS